MHANQLFHTINQLFHTVNQLFHTIDTKKRQSFKYSYSSMMLKTWSRRNSTCFRMYFFIQNCQLRTNQIYSNVTYFLVGDPNLPFCNWHSMTCSVQIEQEVVNALRDFTFQPLIHDTPTHKLGNTLGNILTTSDGAFVYCQVRRDLQLSYHYPIILRIDSRVLPINTK